METMIAVSIEIPMPLVMVNSVYLMLQPMEG